MVWDGEWATTHESTLFRQEVRPYFPPGPTLVLLYDNDNDNDNNKKHENGIDTSFHRSTWSYQKGTRNVSWKNSRPNKHQ